MNLFGIGLPEMGIIAVVALLIFGPDKLPEVMGQAGKMVKDFRSMTAGLTGEFEKTIAEAKEIGNSITKEVGGMSKEVNAVTNSVKKDLGSKTTTPAPKKGMTSASATKKAGTTSTSATKASSASKPTAKASTSSTTTKAPAKAATASSSTATASATTAAPTTVTPPTPKASREDPIADVSLFEPAPIERKPRARRATPTTFAKVDVFASAPDGDDARIADALANGDPITIPAPASDDALVRARQRRQSAGYARQSA
ncbi:MAG: twin-arginine translocase TatA/TatE family subunit [Thermomicrobiales bacterium]